MSPAGPHTHRLRFDDSPTSLANWAAPEFEADPADEALLRVSVSWPWQAAVMEGVWPWLCWATVFALLLPGAWHNIQRLQRNRVNEAAPKSVAESPSLRRYWYRTLWHCWHRTFSVDLRALAIFRIAFSIVVLWDLVQQAWELRALRTDSGVFYRYEEPGQRLFCPHCVNGSIAWQTLMMAVTMAAFLCVLLGWHTTSSTLVAWQLWGSACEAGGRELMCQGADGICETWLLWASLLPWGQSYSLDAVFRARSRQTVAEDGIRRVNPAVSLSVLGLAVSTLDLYVSSTLNRTGPDWSEDWTAVWNVFHDPCLTKPVGHQMAAYPALCRLFAFIGMKLEFWCPLLLFTGALNGGVARGIACLAMIGFHSCLGSAVALGWFQFVSGTVWVAFLPTCMCDLLVCQVANLLAWASRSRTQDMGSRDALNSCHHDGRRKADNKEPSHIAGINAGVRNVTSAVQRRRQAGALHFNAIDNQAAHSVPAASYTMTVLHHTGSNYATTSRLRALAALMALGLFCLARTGVSPFAHAICEHQLGLAVGWALFSRTRIITCGKLAAVGTLADGSQLRLNALGFRAKRAKLLDAARHENSTEDWFVFGNGFEGGHRMDAFVFPRQAREMLTQVGQHRDARLRYQHYLCRHWNLEFHDDRTDIEGAGSAADLLRLVRVQLYSSLKVGVVDPTRGFMGVEGLRLQWGAFECGRPWQDYIRDDRYAQEQLASLAYKDQKELRLLRHRGAVRVLAVVGRMMRSHIRRGGRGAGQFRVDLSMD